MSKKREGAFASSSRLTKRRGLREEDDEKLSQGLGCVQNNTRTKRMRGNVVIRKDQMKLSNHHDVCVEDRGDVTTNTNALLIRARALAD